ncbi:unannotated protein [freshwater metagenome]|uniref:Unannotated protein n=1 Tax=freshwater metagenome TaxID=449393 RepID=A0A6J7C560_9ZZZZ
MVGHAREVCVRRVGDPFQLAGEHPALELDAHPGFAVARAEHDASIVAALAQRGRPRRHIRGVGEVARRSSERVVGGGEHRGRGLRIGGDEFGHFGDGRDIGAFAGDALLRQHLQAIGDLLVRALPCGDTFSRHLLVALGEHHVLCRSD